MHSFKQGDWAIIHNGDYSGNVEIKKFDSKNPDFKPALAQITVPFALLEAFVAEKYRSDRIAELEQMSAEDLLRAR